ncbi:MAG TPA: TetR/AcrR family transcriptional regulator [Bacilli bacterium]
MSGPLDDWADEMLNLLGDKEKMTDKQINIIKAAVETFSEKGYAAASTSEIARKAGVAEGTIFRHYKTKKDLLLSIMAPVMGKLIAPFALRDFNKVLERDYPQFSDFLRAVIENRAEFAKKHLPLLKVFLQEIPFHPELREHYKKLFAKPVMERFLQVVKRYQEAGQIIDLPPMAVVRLTATTIIGYVIARNIIAPEMEWDDEAETERIVQFVMHGLTPPVH